MMPSSTRRVADELPVVNTRRATLALAAAATLALAACGSDAKTADTGPAATTTITPTSMATPMTTSMGSATTAPMGAASTAPMAATGDAVRVGDFAFEPADLRVAVGTTVTWTNDHDQPHTATSAGNFDTGAIQPGESKTVTFDRAGTFSYICSFHPFMTGTVTVA